MRLTILFLCLGLALPACGGLDETLARTQGPQWRLSEYFQGRKIGHQTIRDRNQNVRQVAQIERSCVPVPIRQEGRCEDRIQYLYAAAGAPTPRLRDTLTWSVHYLTDQNAQVRLADGAGDLSGRILGASMLLEGTRLTPEFDNGPWQTAPSVRADWRSAPGRDEVLAKSPAAAVRVRLHLRPNRTLLQTEHFRAWGIEIGTVETLWIDQN